MHKLLPACLTMLSRRSAVLALAVVGVLSLSAGEARAGIIVPWAQQPASASVDFIFDAAGAASTVEQPVSDVPANREADENSLRLKAPDGLVQTNAGGAAAPVSGSIGSAGGAPAAIFDSPALATVSCSFGYLRESAPQLPQPLLGEMLDPPRARA